MTSGGNAFSESKGPPGNVRSKTNVKDAITQITKIASRILRSTKSVNPRVKIKAPAPPKKVTAVNHPRAVGISKLKKLRRITEATSTPTSIPHNRSITSGK